MKRFGAISTAIPWRATARALALRRSLLRFSALFSSCFGSLVRRKEVNDPELQREHRMYTASSFRAQH